ncbi:RNA-directed DNA polymerase [Roseovarius sp. SK2]|uniref:RNA-directed DNA polymerase n=1 Tax=Roseovarius TaxID=74030 RepID=UPI00237C3507|nr:RNA-directed DNA polymerase [Roseovarius sp. SK2]MDD9725262.1 RNA-directed DNA polymerase [Roseovarius sp. SK2]
MFKLTEDELDRAFSCISHHGFSTLFPDPPEWEDLVIHWSDIKALLINEDLDTYIPKVPLRVFAPKNRFNIRVVTHLHPIDLVIYTALVLIVRDDIEKARLPKARRRVFSFRADARIADQLYQSNNAFATYKNELRRKAEKASVRYVALADIADFFPRLYQHRLENIIQTVATTTRSEEVARVLIKKFVPKVCDGTSYGIPVGPYASRNLAEALLIDVDDALTGKKFDFVRWVDDFAFFCKSDEEAQHCLFFLGQWLFEKHGLTLQGAKTKIVPVETFVDHHLQTHEGRLEERAEILRDLWGRISPYEDDEEEELNEEELEELQAVNFQQMLAESLQDIDNVDYEMISFLLGRLTRIDEFQDEWRATLVDLVLDNLEHLYPISDSLARFFKSFENIEAVERRRIARSLLRPILKGKVPPPDYYVMWVMSIFMSSEHWNNADKILKIFSETHSEVVRRYAALALEKNGTRAQVLPLKDHFDHASPMLQLAILRATRLLGADERKFWKRSKGISDHLDKRV